VPPEPATPLSIGYLIKRVELGLRWRLDEHLRTLGLTTQQYSVLMVLRGTDGLSAADLARHFRITPQAMSQIITVMEQRRLIVRRPDELHRRTLRTSLDDAGRKLLEDASLVHHEVERVMVAGFTAGQVASLQEMLVQCAGALEMLDDLRGVPDPPLIVEA
jgi:DNA-binding MarR family transcriptional regulator